MSARPVSDLSAEQSVSGEADVAAVTQSLENGIRNNASVPEYSLKVCVMSERKRSSGSNVADKRVVKVIYEVEQWNSNEAYTAYRVVEKDGVKIEEGEIAFDKSDSSGTRQREEVYSIASGNDEGTYNVVYYLKKGSQELEKQTAEFILDETAPEVQIETSSSEDNEFEEKVTYGVTVTEQNFDDCSIVIYVERIAVDGKKEYTLSNKDSELIFENGKKTEIEFEEDGIYTVYTVAKDLAGNGNTTEETKFVIDNTSPEVSITNADDYSLMDGLSFNTEQELLVLKLGVTDLSMSDNAEDCSVTLIKNGVEQSLPSLVWKKDGYTQYTNLSFDANAEDGSYKIIFYAKDKNPKNEGTTQTAEFIIDNIAPVIAITDVKVSYDRQEDEPVEVFAEEGKDVYYLNDDARVSFKVIEQNWSSAQVNVRTMKKGIGQIEPLSPLPMEEPEDITNPQCTMSVVYTDEGRYTTVIQGQDAAGNKSNEHTRYFVIDKMAPEFQIQRMEDGNWSDMENNAAYKDKNGQVLRFSIKDENHNKDSYQIKVTKLTEKNSRPVVTILGNDIEWQEEEDTGTIYFENSSLFREEGRYTVEITGKDKAGNEPVEKTVVTFIVDWTAPVITQAAGSNIADGAYYDRPVTLSYTIREFNVDGAEASIEVTRIYEGKTYHETDDKTGTLILDKTQTQFYYMCSSQGQYTIKIRAKDKAGNEAKQKLSGGGPEEGYTIHFVVDMDRPELAATGVRNQQKTKNPVTVTFRAVDRNHDYNSYNIHVTRSNMDEELEAFDIKGTKLSVYDVDETGWTKSEYASDEQRKFLTERRLQFSKEGIYEITFTGTDRAQNEAQEKKIIFYIDHTAPQITNIRYSDVNGLIWERYHNIYSNKAIMVEFSVKDMVTGVNDQRVSVRVGKAQDPMADTSLFIAHKSAGNRYYVYVPTDLRVNEFDSPITIRAEDVLGNANNITSANLVYNTFIPSIQMECDTDYSKWTNKNVTFHTTVGDERSGLKEVIYRINGKTVKKITFDKPVKSYDYDITASESASKVTGYGVEVEVINNCGTSNIIKRQVYIDKEKPKVMLSGVRNDTHYSTSQVFQTDVQDVSYNKTKTVYVISRKLDGRTYTTSAAVFHSQKYADSCNRKIIKEGLYKIYAITTDGAGNQTISNPIRFVIDKTSPKVAVSGITEDSMSGTPVTLDFTCEESFFATNQVTIQVEKTLDGETVTERITGFPVNTKKTAMSHTFSQDGTYTVTISAIDKAGNTARAQTIHFSVDRTKPEIRITGTGNYEQWSKPATVQFSVEESYYSGNQVVITGTCTDLDGNVTEVQLPQFTNSGKLSSLSQIFQEDGIYFFEIVSKDEAGNQDSCEIHFTVDQTRPQINKVGSCDGEYYQEFKLADTLEEIFRDLTVISYRILLNGVEYNGTDEITEEGKYNLYVEVEDELGHRNSENVEFIIDHTAPKVIFTGVKDGENVHERGAVTLTLTNTEDEITAVRMNGVDYGAATRRLSYSEYGSYQIEVDCRDKAGNAVTRTVYFVYSNPLTIALMLGGMGLLIGCTCIWLWIRTRRKEEEEKKI